MNINLVHNHDLFSNIKNPYTFNGFFKQVTKQIP